jgi:hypothetical protein
MHSKQGKATFTLSTGEVFRGVFELNMENDKYSDYGIRK